MIGLLIAASALNAPPYVPDYRIAYGSAPFRRLVADSCVAESGCRPEEFYRHWNQTMREKVGVDAQGWIARARKRLAESKNLPETRRAVGEEMFWVIKKTITKFSLDRGFEFANVVKTGERQCHLQSTLVAAMLQAAGLDAGLAMVWANQDNQTTNLGHVTAILRLSPTQSVLVDDSERYPFHRHQGLFLWEKEKSGYSFLRPIYGDKNAIVGWTDPNGANRRALNVASPISTAYVDSQFDYYRGERAPGGILANPKTATGLAASERFFVASLKRDPRNLLSAYMLATTYARQGKSAAARKMLTRATELYRKAGWTPSGVREAARSIR